jgi:UDP-glucose 4-epimerase
MSTMDQSCLITGGAGFIGSELSRLAAERFQRVVIVDNLANGKRENVAEILSPAVGLEVTDVRATSEMTRLMAGIDVVMHLACLGVRHSIHSPAENHEVNATATLGLLGAARAAGVKRFVYVSTSEVYGSVSPVPPMAETHHTQPMTVYGAAKLAGECYTRAYHRTYGYDTVVIRPFNAYGPRSHHEGDSGEVIPKFMLRCMAGQPLIVFGDGSHTRDFTYVSDTARGILAAALAPQAVGRTINLGTGREIEIGTLAREVCRVVGRPDARIVFEPPRPGDVLRLRADVTLARELLGFEPQVDLEAGLAMLRDWYLAQPVSPRELLQHEVVHNWLPLMNSGRDR